MFPLEFCRSEMIKLFSYLFDIMRNLSFASPPALPSSMGVLYDVLDLYLGVDSMQHSSLPDEFKFDLVYSKASLSEQGFLVDSLSKSMKLLAPYLLEVNSVVSMQEPLLHLSFRAQYVYYAIFGKVNI